VTGGLDGYAEGMVRRRVVRGLAIVLLMLCVGAWVGSYFRGIKFQVRHRNEIGIYLVNGRIGMAHYRGASREGWQLDTFDCRTNHWSDWDKSGLWHAVGFCVARQSNPTWLVTVPYWFVTLLAGGWLVLAWRISRPTGHRGFPVEPTAARGQVETGKPG
jgi:hypothetical protein